MGEGGGGERETNQGVGGVCQEVGWEGGGDVRDRRPTINPGEYVKVSETPTPAWEGEGGAEH